LFPLSRGLQIVLPLLRLFQHVQLEFLLLALRELCAPGARQDAEESHAAEPLVLRE
jgi:hypothetical protein